MSVSLPRLDEEEEEGSNNVQIEKVIRHVNLEGDKIEESKSKDQTNEDEDIEEVHQLAIPNDNDPNSKPYSLNFLPNSSTCCNYLGARPLKHYDKFRTRKPHFSTEIPLN